MMYLRFFKTINNKKDGCIYLKHLRVQATLYIYFLARMD